MPLYQLNQKLWAKTIKILCSPTMIADQLCVTASVVGQQLSAVVDSGR